MEVDKADLINFIAKKTTTFLIPVFQRKYKWRWNEEIKDLINDLEKFKNKESGSEKYFFGTIMVKNILEETNIVTGSKPKYMLVDGQQRIITLLLMCSAINQVLKYMKKEELAKYNFLLSDIQKILRTDKETFKLTRIQDEDIIKQIIQDDPDHINEKYKESNYFTIYSKFKSYFKEMNIKEIEKYFNNVLEKIEVIIMRLDLKDNEFLIFEAINSRGQNLSSDDLIKNYIMMHLTNNKLNDQIDRLEKDFIEETKELEKNKENLLTELYRQTLAIETGYLQKAKGRQLYEAFVKWATDKKIIIDKSFIDEKFYDLAVLKYIFKEKKWSNRSLPLIENNSLSLVKSKKIKFYSIIHLAVKHNSNFENNKLKISLEEDRNIEHIVNYFSKFIVARTLYSARIEAPQQTALLSYNLKTNLNQRKPFKWFQSHARVSRISKPASTARAKRS